MAPPTDPLISEQDVDSPRVRATCVVLHRADHEVVVLVVVDVAGRADRKTGEIARCFSEQLRVRSSEAERAAQALLVAEEDVRSTGNPAVAEGPDQVAEVVAVESSRDRHVETGSVTGRLPGELRVGGAQAHRSFQTIVGPVEEIGRSGIRPGRVFEIGADDQVVEAVVVQVARPGEPEPGRSSGSSPTSRAAVAGRLIVPLRRPSVP